MELGIESDCSSVTLVLEKGEHKQPWVRSALRRLLLSTAYMLVRLTAACLQFCNTQLCPNGRVPCLGAGLLSGVTGSLLLHSCWSLRPSGCSGPCRRGPSRLGDRYVPLADATVSSQCCTPLSSGPAPVHAHQMLLPLSVGAWVQAAKQGFELCTHTLRTGTAQHECGQLRRSHSDVSRRAAQQHAHPGTPCQQRQDADLAVLPDDGGSARC